MARPPDIPPDQRGSKSAPNDDAGRDRRDQATGVQSPQPGDADVNLDTEGRFGNLRQNLTTHWKTQQR